MGDVRFAMSCPPVVRTTYTVVCRVFATGRTCWGAGFGSVKTGSMGGEPGVLGGAARLCVMAGCGADCPARVDGSVGDRPVVCDGSVGDRPVV